MMWSHDWKESSCPWHFEMFALFAHPVSRVSSQTFFLLQICLDPHECLGQPLSCLAISVLSGWVSFMEKGSFLDGQPLTFVPSGNTLDQSPWTSMSVSGSLGRVLPSVKHRQSLYRWYTWTELVQNQHYQSHFLHCCQSQVVRHLANVGCFHTVSQGDITSFIWLLKSRHQVATLYQLMLMLGAGFGCKPHCWMQVAECPHAMGPILGTKFAVTCVTFPFTGR